MATHTSKTSKSSRPSNKSSKSRKPRARHRSGLLTAILVIVIIHGALLTLMAIGQNRTAEVVTHPVVLGLFALSSLASAVAGYALWRWKKWGLTLYLVATFVEAALYLIATGSILGVFAAFIPLMIVAYVVRSEWKQFE